MINSWKKLTQDNKVRCIIFVLGTIVALVMGRNFLIHSYNSSQGSVTQAGEGVNVTNIGSGTVNIGNDEAENTDKLENRKKEIRRELEEEVKQEFVQDRLALENELQSTHKKLEEITKNFEKFNNKERQEKSSFGELFWKNLLKEFSRMAEPVEEDHVEPDYPYPFFRPPPPPPY